MIRRKWRKRSEHSRLYASLSGEGETHSDNSSKRKPRRKVVPRGRTIPDVSASSSSTSSKRSLKAAAAVRFKQAATVGSVSYTDSRDDEGLVANYEAKFLKETAFRPISNSKADDCYDDDSDEERSVQYIASQYNEKAGRGTRKSLETTLPSPRRKNQFSFLKLTPSSSSSLSGLKVGLSGSFDTEETHLEEASATSISTMTSCEDDSSRMSSSTKKVRWLDETEQQDLAVVHSVQCDPPVTCRVVILLLMNNGTEATNNFEFLHCEYRLDQRLKVSDALSQITELVLGTREHPCGDAASRDNVEKKAGKRASSSFRPFTALYYQGRELINVCSLQDFPLQDGHSLLVALRKGPDDRDLLLKQSALLLSDRRLNKEIRKARISGRSLQVLLSSKEMREKRKRPATPNESKDNNNNDLGSCDDASEADVPLNSAFWNLSLDAIEDVDFGESTFDAMDDEHSDWFDDAFSKEQISFFTSTRRAAGQIYN